MMISLLNLLTKNLACQILATWSLMRLHKRFYRSLLSFGLIIEAMIATFNEPPKGTLANQLSESAVYRL
jgi:hypothetical protein